MTGGSLNLNHTIVLRNANYKWVGNGKVEGKVFYNTQIAHGAVD